MLLTTELGCPLLSGSLCPGGAVGEAPAPGAGVGSASAPPSEVRRLRLSPRRPLAMSHSWSNRHVGFGSGKVSRPRLGNSSFLHARNCQSVYCRLLPRPPKPTKGAVIKRHPVTTPAPIPNTSHDIRPARHPVVPQRPAPDRPRRAARRESTPAGRSCRCSSSTTPPPAPGRWAAPPAGGCTTAWPRCSVAEPPRRRADPAPGRQRRHHRRTGGADRGDRGVHRRLRRPVGAPGRPGGGGALPGGTTPPDAHNDAVPPGLDTHQDRRPLQRLHPVRQRLPRARRPETASPAPHTIRAAQPTRPTASGTGTCCRRNPTGHPACATPGPPARTAPCTGPRPS